MRLYLARHPKPLVAQGVCYGVSDVACQPNDLEDAAADLLKILPKGLEILSSPLSRCEHLTQILCRLEPDFSYKADEKLAEMNFGAWEMQAWQSISPDELVAWTDAFASYRCGGTGESAGQFVSRIAQRLFESAQSGQDQIWTTHAGVIRALQWLASQPYDLFTALAQGRQLDPALLLSRLRAADWPQGELAWSRVQPWDWPPDWPPSVQISALGLG